MVSEKKTEKKNRKREKGIEKWNKVQNRVSYVRENKESKLFVKRESGKFRLKLAWITATGRPWGTLIISIVFSGIILAALSQFELPEITYYIILPAVYIAFTFFMFLFLFLKGYGRAPMKIFMKEGKYTIETKNGKAVWIGDGKDLEIKIYMPGKKRPYGIGVTGFVGFNATDSTGNKKKSFSISMSLSKKDLEAVSQFKNKHKLEGVTQSMDD